MFQGMIILMTALKASHNSACFKYNNLFILFYSFPEDNLGVSTGKSAYCGDVRTALLM